jgi:hypothetical protein
LNQIICLSNQLTLNVHDEYCLTLNVHDEDYLTLNVHDEDYLTLKVHDEDYYRKKGLKDIVSLSYKF